MIQIDLKEFEADEIQANYFHLLSSHNRKVNIKVVAMNEGQTTSFIRSREGSVKYIVLKGKVLFEEHKRIPQDRTYVPQYFALNTPPPKISLLAEKAIIFESGQVAISNKNSFSRVVAEEPTKLLQIIEYTDNTVEFTNR